MALNDSSGNLIGVDGHVKFGENEEWKVNLSVVGWPVRIGLGTGFNLNLFYDDDLDIEINLTEQALENILQAIRTSSLYRVLA